MQQKRLSSVTSSADIIGGNDDLLMEILFLLPVESLFRIRLVSKHWRSLISTKYFHHLHCENRLRRRPQHQFILRSAASPQQWFICDLTAKTVLPLGFHFEFQHVKILQSSHGLLLLECRKFPRGGERRICVYNPATTKRINLLDQRAGHDSSPSRSRFCLVYDPSISYDYTVYRLITYRANFSFIQISVYDSRTQQWERKGKFDETLQRFPQGMLCNDRLYFITSQSSSFFIRDGVISTVDNPPRCSYSSWRKKYVVESNGHLHCLVLSLEKKENLVHVYEMTHDKCWVMSNRVDSDRPLLATLDVEEIEVLGFVRGERLNDSILVYHVPGKMMIYRFCDEVSEEIVDFSKESYCQKGVLQFEFKGSHHYIETLASVKYRYIGKGYTNIKLICSD